MRQWRRPLKYPDRADPRIKKLYEVMNYERIGVQDLADRSGVAMGTISGWRTHSPRIDALDAALGALGYELVIKRKRERLYADDEKLCTCGGSVGGQLE